MFQGENIYSLDFLLLFHHGKSDESLASLLPADPDVRQPQRYFNKVDPYILGAKTWNIVSSKH